jgi:hypothetical protein
MPERQEIGAIPVLCTGKIHEAPGVDRPAADKDNTARIAARLVE